MGSKWMHWYLLPSNISRWSFDAPHSIIFTKCYRNCWTNPFVLQKSSIFISHGWPNNSSLWNKWMCCLRWLTKTAYEDQLIRCPRYTRELASRPHAIATGLSVNRWDSKSSKIATARWISNSPFGGKNILAVRIRDISGRYMKRMNQLVRMTRFQ